MIELRDAGPGDAARLNDGLARLSAELGDPHRAGPEDIARLCFGPEPAGHGLIAEAGVALMGVALYSPLVSTAQGGAGTFVSDLWVAPGARGTGLGPRLLAEVARRAEARWGAIFLRLAVYHTSPRARGFYDRLGFTALEGQTALGLSGAAFDRLKEEG